MERRITKVVFGNKRWEVGVNGCKTIEVQPVGDTTLIGVDFDDGLAITAHVKEDDVTWHHKEVTIVIPDLAAPIDVKEAS